MRHALLIILFILVSRICASDYNAVQTSINLIIEFSKDLEHVPDSSKVNHKEAGDITYYLEMLTMPIKNSKAVFYNQKKLI